MTTKNIFFLLLIFIFVTSCSTDSEPEPIAPEIITLFAAEEVVETGDKTLVICVASDEDTSSENLDYTLTIANGSASSGPNRYSIIAEKNEGTSPVVTCIVTDDAGLSTEQSLNL